MEISAEVHFAQLLASNQQDVRDKALKKLGMWFSKKSASVNAFDEDGMLKMWKGLFYYFWNCDKPLVQEDAADVISKFIHQFKSSEYAFLYIHAFFITMGREWIGIDHYRIEKFLMLIRKILREAFECLKLHKWKLSCITDFKKTLKKTVLNPVCEKCPLSLRTHITDIYMEELAKVGSEELTPKLVQKFIAPYCHVLIQSKNKLFLGAVSHDIFLYLINQDVDEETFEEYPVLQFDAPSIRKMLMRFANKPSVSRRHLKIIYGIVKRFQDYEDGNDESEKLFQDQGELPILNKEEIDKAALKYIKQGQGIRMEMAKLKRLNKRKHEDIVDLDLESDSEEIVDLDLGSDSE